MLVHQKTKKLVLNLSNPKRVTTVIPTAKEFVYRGKNLVAVPHRLDEVRVLRNLGIAAPGPNRYYYSWPTAYDKPYLHQQEMAEFMVLNPRCYNLGDMGTGKTLATLWAYDYLREIGAVKRALIVTPLSTLERTWGDEIFTHFPHLSFGVLHGSTATRTKMLNYEFDVYLINHDGIKTKGIAEKIIEREDIDVVVVDELAVFRTAGADRWKYLRRIVSKKQYVWGLTGTPIPNVPTDAWAQCRLVTPDSVSSSFQSFRDSVMYKVSNFKWVAKPGALSVVERAMQPAIRFSRAECIDLPPTTTQYRFVELSKEQKRMYEEMLRRLKTEAEQGQLVAVNEAVKVNKLLQIACGGGYSVDGSRVIIPSQARIDETIEIIEQAGAKVIVFVPIIAALESLASQIAKHFSVAVIHGQINKRARDEIFGAFKKQKDPRVLVAQPAAMSHGLTLTEADTIVWFAPVNSGEIYEQACARIVRPGQKRNTLIVNIEGTPIERRIYERLQKKGNMQGVLLDMFQENRK